MWLDRYRAILCDLDGCLISGDRLLPGAVGLAAHAGDRLWIISNNSTDTPHSLAERLMRLGLPIPPARIVLAGTTAVDHIAATRPGARVTLYGCDRIRDFAVRKGLLLADDRAEIVLLTRDERFSYDRLNHLIRQIGRGARLVVANGDHSHPGADGHPVAETGALLAAIVACLPGIRYHTIGKPWPAMYERVLDGLGMTADAVLAIGDNPATDGEGARRMGMDCALIGVLPGMQGRTLAALLSDKGDPLSGRAAVAE